MAGLDILSPDESIVYGRVRIRILCKLLQKYRTTGSQPDDQIVKRYFTEFATYLRSQNAKAPLQLGRVKDIADRETSDNKHQEDDAGRNHKRSYLQNFLNLDERQRESYSQVPFKPEHVPSWEAPTESDRAAAFLGGLNVFPFSSAIYICQYHVRCESCSSGRSLQTYLPEPQKVLRVMTSEDEDPRTVSYYFEVTQLNLSTSTVTLRRQGTTIDDASITLDGVPNHVQRSNVFTPPAGATDYVFHDDALDGGDYMVRIVALQSNFTNTQATHRDFSSYSRS